VLAKVKKLLSILSTPGLWRYARHGVAPAIEHQEVMAGLTISTCIDVGANIGQFSALIANLHPRAKILAFEPMPAACARYRSAIPASRARLFEIGIGSENSVKELHVTNRADSSSLLRPGAGQTKAFGVYESTTLSVPVRRLGDVLSAGDITRPCLLKIDVQGGELDVLAGAENLFGYIDFICVELSYVELYESQPLATEVLKFLFGAGYQLQGIYNQVSTRAFGPTQADFLLARDGRRK
jgi:FkbM family methyltransferase